MPKMLIFYNFSICFARSARDLFCLMILFFVCLHNIIYINISNSFCSVNSFSTPNILQNLWLIIRVSRYRPSIFTSWVEVLKICCFLCLWNITVIDNNLPDLVYGHSFPREFWQGRTFVLTSNDHPGHSCSNQMTTPNIRAHIKLPPRTFVLISNYHPDIRLHDYSVL